MKAEDLKTVTMSDLAAVWEALNELRKDFEELAGELSEPVE